MSSASPVLRGTRPPTFDRLAVLELVGGFLLMTLVFGIFAARAVAVPDEHGYTVRSLTLGFAIGAGIALAIVLGSAWGWRRTGGRPAQRRAMQVWRSGVVPDSPAERALLLPSLERQERTLTRSGLALTVLGVIWFLLAVLQIAIARDPLTPVAWALLAASFVRQTIVSRRRQRRLPELVDLISRLRSEEQ